MPTRTSSSEFTDAQRATIYARDRAICGYSGRSLWLADSGAAPSAIDWVDHVLPVSRGGKPTVDNGIACSHLYNSQKRAGSGVVLLYHCGRPTVDYFTFFHAVRPEIAEHLRRFSNLDASDWYFNRALFHVHLGAAARGAVRRDGKPLSRDTEYRGKAALRFLERWRKESAGIPTLSRRSLLPRRPSADQKLLLSVMDADSTPKLHRLISALAPYSSNSWRVLEKLATIHDDAKAKAFANIVARHPKVAHTVKQAVKRNIDSLSFNDT
jgi:hypothetical protein